MEKKVIERINELLKNKHLTTNQLARILGISPSSVYNYLAGESKAPMSFVIGILESFPDISAEWLLRGDGEMLKPAKKSHYLEMAEKVNGTMMASENTGEPLNLQTMYDSLMKTIEQQGKRLARLEELSKYDK